MVATVLYMIVDAAAGRASFASAGHLPPLLLQDGGGARFLAHTPPPPLGVAGHADFESWETALGPGEGVLLYTDGLGERRGEPIDVGLARLRDALSEQSGDLEELSSKVLASAAGGAGPQDDAALLAVKLIGYDAAALEVDLPAEPESVAYARHGVERWLEHSGDGVDDLFAIKIAVSEACANAVEHAYGPEPGCTFHLHAERSGDAVVVEVSDRGRWRAPRGAQRGLGLRMIEQLMDSVEIERTSAGTLVRMRKEADGDG